jgi:hypothetical protein
MFRNSKNVKMKKRLRWRVATVEAGFTKRRSVDFVNTYLGCVAWLRNCATHATSLRGGNRIHEIRKRSDHTAN